MKRDEKVIFGILSVVGLSIWLGVSFISKRQEAWDSPLFLDYAVPLMMLVTFVAGIVQPGRAWHWGLGIVVLQPIALLVLGGRVGPLIGVGLIFFGIFACICALSAWIGGSLRLVFQRVMARFRGSPN